MVAARPARDPGGRRLARPECGGNDARRTGRQIRRRTRRPHAGALRPRDDHAKWLAEHEAPASLPAGSSTHVAALQQAARRAADAETVLGAAIATASMLKICGDCHRAVGTRPGLALPVRPELGGVVGHMLAHQTAADEMAQGLIAPSSELSRKGAEGFRGAPLHPDKFPSGTKLGSQLLASEERIHQLASQAVRAEDPGARAVFYGQILARCADCHALHRTIWGPSGR
jgi:hypothetical protein